ncbi:hypothetical protein FRC08_018821 [Ceratobasidium sp. 394]|nr:hypothetical protein FRC08_018821 [Ceratobasidium sp. 394]
MSATEEKARSASTSSFITAPVLNAAIFGVEVIAFMVICRSSPSIYEPRSCFFAREQTQNGMDAYCFVRYLRVMFRIFLPIWLVSWAVLLPVNSAGLNHKNGLDQFISGNITQDRQVRYAAHVLLAWILAAWVMYNIEKECANSYRPANAILSTLSTRARHRLIPPNFSSTFLGASSKSGLIDACTLPNVVVGIISGVLPPVALAILMMLPPIILRLLARFEGIPRRTGLKLSLMTRYFNFQVIVRLGALADCCRPYH